MENFDHILLFKTNLEAADQRQIKELFKKEGITGWNIDLDDEDHVLRVVSYSLKHSYIIQLIRGCGFECCELT
jgi:hypothetical protein